MAGLRTVYGAAADFSASLCFERRVSVHLLRGPNESIRLEGALAAAPSLHDGSVRTSVLLSTAVGAAHTTQSDSNKAPTIRVSESVLKPFLRWMYTTRRERADRSPSSDSITAVLALSGNVTAA